MINKFATQNVYKYVNIVMPKLGFLYFTVLDTAK